jgi:hypothetical protein
MFWPTCSSCLLMLSICELNFIYYTNYLHFHNQVSSFSPAMCGSRPVLSSNTPVDLLFNLLQICLFKSVKSNPSFPF